MNSRIRRLPNLQNHQVDSDSDSSSTDYEYIDTSNEFQAEEDRRYKRRPDLDFAWAQEKEPGKKVYKNKKLRSKKVTKTKTTRKPEWTKKRPKRKPNQPRSNPRFPRNPSSQFQVTQLYFSSTYLYHCSSLLVTPEEHQCPLSRET